MNAILYPACGRRYETTDAMLKDWKEGKDFRFRFGPYCSVRDTVALGEQFDMLVLVNPSPVPLHVTLPL